MPSDPETEALRQRLDALVMGIDAAEAKAVVAHHRVQAARLLLEKEHATAANLKRKAATAKGLLPSFSSSSTTSDMVDSAVYGSALITSLHVQAMVSSSTVSIIGTRLPTVGSTTTVTCQPTPMVPSSFEPLMAPLPAAALPLGFLPYVASMVPDVPHVAQASPVVPCTATPTHAAPRTAPESPIAPHLAVASPMATDGPLAREWSSSTIVYTCTVPPTPKSQHAEQQTGMMVVSMEDVVVEERPMHQGCMAGFLHLFDHPWIRRLHRSWLHDAVGGIDATRPVIVVAKRDATSHATPVTPALASHAHATTHHRLAPVVAPGATTAATFDDTGMMTLRGHGPHGAPPVVA
jgi:hypothetical protein